MNAVFKTLRWEKGTAIVEPKSAGYVFTTPAKMFVTLKTDDGHIIIKDIADIVKRVNGWKNFSEKRFFILKHRLEEVRNFQVDENEEILGLAGTVLF